MAAGRRIGTRMNPVSTAVIFGTPFTFRRGAMLERIVPFSAPEPARGRLHDHVDTSVGRLDHHFLVGTPRPDVRSARVRLVKSSHRGAPEVSGASCTHVAQLEDVVMRTIFDFSPLYRSTVGFERVFDLLDNAARLEPMTNWPPYDIEKVDEDRYRISMAVAGFSPDDIELTQHGNVLLVSGQKAGREQREILHQGIASRQFKQTFNLDDHVKVVAADLHDGLLSIELVREVPEQLKPRRIEIGAAGGAQDNGPKAIGQETEPQRKVA